MSEYLIETGVLLQDVLSKDVNKDTIYVCVKHWLISISCIEHPSHVTKNTLHLHVLIKEFYSYINKIKKKNQPLEEYH